jgi:hypothetical protein
MWTKSALVKIPAPACIANKNALWSVYCWRADSPFASLRERFMRSKLEAIAGPMKGATLYLTDELWLGENSDHGASIDSSVGGPQCLIKQENGIFRLCSPENQQSVLVNRQPVTDRVLRHGDEISIGESVFLVALPEDASRFRLRAKSRAGT